MNQRDRLIEIAKSIKEFKGGLSYDEFADYLIENGVIVLPCKVGDKFYRIENFCNENGLIEDWSIHKTLDCETCNVSCNAEKRIVEYSWMSVEQILQCKDYLGKYFFLTKEEAEKALEGMKE